MRKGEKRKLWTKREDAILRKHYRFGVRTVIEKLPGRTKRAIVLRARRLNLDGNTWTPNEDHVIEMCYRDFGAAYCQRYMPYRTLVAIRCRAARIGVRRDLTKRKKPPPKGDWIAAMDYALRKPWR